MKAIIDFEEEKNEFTKASAKEKFFVALAVIFTASAFYYVVDKLAEAL